MSNHKAFAVGFFVGWFVGAVGAISMYETGEMVPGDPDV